jgi:ribonucleoside-triphosphate reductase
MSSFFTKMLHEQISQKIAFIKNYFEQANPADGSVVDANANVTEKNVATLLAELHKDSNVQISRRLIADKIESIFGVNTANDYLHKLQHHEIYRHDESSIIMPYCVAISMYPFLMN